MVEQKSGLKNWVKETINLTKADEEEETDQGQVSRNNERSRSHIQARRLPHYEDIKKRENGPKE